MKAKASRTGVITIVNKLPSGPAFGVLDESGEHMFITSKIAEVAAVEIGKKYRAEFVVNSIPDKTPWFATRLDSLDGTLDYDEVYDDLEAILGKDQNIPQVIDYMKGKDLKILRQSG